MTSIELIEKNNNYTEIKNYLVKKNTNLIFEKNLIKNLRDHYNLKFYSTICLDDSNEIVGVLIFYINKNLKNKKLGYTFYDSFIYDDDKIAKELILETKKFLKNNKIEKLTINSISIIQDMDGESKTNYCIDIFLNEKNLNWDNKPGVFRTEVRKAKKRSFTVKIGKIFPIKDYYNLYLLNQTKKNIPMHNEIFFEKIFDMNSSIIFSCSKDGILAGYILIIIFNSKAHLLFSNISDKLKSNGVNQFLFWEAIKYLSKNNVTKFFLGPSNPDGATAFFKKKIGSDEIIFNQYYLTESENTESMIKENKIKKIFKSLVKYMPKHILSYFLKKKRFYGKVL